jgi:hypothetical protein
LPTISLWYDCRRPANQDEKRRLEGILDIVMIVEDAAADTPDHRAMPPHQRRGGSFVPLFDEALQQLPIAQPRPILLKHDFAKLLYHLAYPRRHRVLLGARKRSCSIQYITR